MSDHGADDLQRDLDIARSLLDKHGIITPFGVPDRDARNFDLERSIAITFLEAEKVKARLLSVERRSNHAHMFTLSELKDNFEDVVMAREHARRILGEIQEHYDYVAACIKAKDGQER